MKEYITGNTVTRTDKCNTAYSVKVDHDNKTVIYLLNHNYHMGLSTHQRIVEAHGLLSYENITAQAWEEAGRKPKPYQYKLGSQMTNK